MTIAKACRLPAATALGALLLGIGGAAQAQNANEPIVNLPDVTVSASRGSPLALMDMSTTVITHDEVQAAPEPSVDQILNKIPGIFIPQQPTAQLHPTGQVLSLRGFGTSTNGLTLVLLDGIPLNDPYFRTVNWAQIPKDSIERIEIIRGGGATSLWGNLALGGVINIVTREPGNGSNHVQASYGSFNTASVDASVGGAITDKIKVGITYDGTKTDGYDQTPKQYRNPGMDATASTESNFTTSIFFTPDDLSKYYLKLLISQTDENGLTYRIAHNDWDTFRVSFGGMREVGAKTTVNLNGWFQGTTMGTVNASNGSYTLATPTAGVPYISQRENAYYTIAGSSLYVQSERGQVKDIKAGVDFRTISTSDPLNIFNSAGFLGSIASAASNQFEGVFAQGTYRFDVLPLDVTLGLREDFWQANSASITGDYNGSVIDNHLRNQSDTHFDPRLGMKYDFADSWDARGAVYEDFSAPGMNQLYRSFVSGSNYTLPDPSLRPQTNFGGEIGIDYTSPKLELAATAYENLLSNYIDYSTVQTGCNAANNHCGTGVTAASTLKQYVNAGDATLRGFEVSGTWRVDPSLELTSGFSRTNAFLTRSTIASDPVHEQLGQVPVWIATAGATFKPTADLSFTLDVKGFPQYWNTTSHTQRNEGAVVADIGASYKIRPNIELFASVQNLGDKQYYDQGLSYTSTGAVNTTSSGTTPALAIPFDATFGIRASF